MEKTKIDFRAHFGSQERKAVFLERRKGIMPIYFAINLYGEGEKADIWVESVEAKNIDEAEDLLARNNPQIILTRSEARKVLQELRKRMEKGKKG
uniref:Uncharacterized protein n=1 Tax=Dictyoglomus turgidum TaxID=513050 RepID=A0A7C3SN81_9BACT